MSKLTLIAILLFILIFVNRPRTTVLKRPLPKQKIELNGLATSYGLKYVDEFSGLTCYLVFTDSEIYCKYIN